MDFDVQFCGSVGRKTPKFLAQAAKYDAMQASARAVTGDGASGVAGSGNLSRIEQEKLLKKAAYDFRAPLIGFGQTVAENPGLGPGHRGGPSVVSGGSGLLLGTGKTEEAKPMGAKARFAAKRKALANQGNG